MDRFCGKCGRKIDEATGKCPFCDKVTPSTPVRPQTNNNQQNSKASNDNATPPKKKLTRKEIKAAKKAEKKANMTIGQKIKRFFIKLIAAILCVAIIGFAGLGCLVYYDIVDIPAISQIINFFTNKTPEEEYANEIEVAFKKNDIDKINQIIFPENYYDIPDNAGVDFNASTEKGKENLGILSSIFEKTKVSYIKTDGTKFVYEISAPNMKNVFSGIDNIQTQEELAKYINNFADKAETTKYTVSVNFVKNDEKISANYKTEEFINAITGGLLDEYKIVFSQYLDDIRTGNVVK